MHSKPYIQGLFCLILITFSFQAFSQEQPTDTVLVFFLGGQSNMDGHGFNKELTENFDKTFNDVYIFQGNHVPDDSPNGGLGKWAKLSPGHGKGFSTDGKDNQLSDRFGVELSFATTLKKFYPNTKIALIKYAKGGSSIDLQGTDVFGTWEPDYHAKSRQNQYDYCLKTIKTALKTTDIDGDGKQELFVPSGIIWMQGETDAEKKEVALRYQANLKRLMDLLRAALLTPDLPVVIGKISTSWNNPEGKVLPYSELVQYAQEQYVKTDPNAEIVRNTRYYRFIDKWHYDSESYIDLGIQFAYTVHDLISFQKIKR